MTFIDKICACTDHTFIPALCSQLATSWKQRRVARPFVEDLRCILYLSPCSQLQIFVLIGQIQDFKGVDTMTLKRIKINTVLACPLVSRLFVN